MCFNTIVPSLSLELLHYCLSGSYVVVFRLLLLPAGPLHHPLPNGNPQRQQRLQSGAEAAKLGRPLVQPQASAAPGGGAAAQLHPAGASCCLRSVCAARTCVQHHPGLHAHPCLRGHGRNASAAASLPVVLQVIRDTSATALSV